MYSKEKTQMVNISSYAGSRKDYVQGGGGNTSVKFDEKLMAIKASGYTLAEVAQEKGYVTIDYKKIKRYYNSVDVMEAKDYEQESLAVNLDSIVLLDGMEQKRPSVEVGFHSFLKKCVIHTHSVYANILCCSMEGENVAKDIFKNSKIGYLFIPYIDPGFRLTLAINQAVQAFKKEHGDMPDAIFLENHGLIVHNDNDKAAIALHETVNEKIRRYLDIVQFPFPGIQKTPEGFLGDTRYLKNFMIQNDIGEDYFNRLRLYPDQLVYIGDKMGNTVQIKNGQIFYRTGETEAQTIEEILLGVIFVIDTIKKAGLTLREMDEKGADFINNWESEKYRSVLIK